MSDDRCNGSDIVVSQAYETIAWLIGPEVVGFLGILLIISLMSYSLMRFLNRIIRL